MDSPTSTIGPEPAGQPAADQNFNLEVNQVAELPPVKAVLEGKTAAVYADENATSPLALSIGRNFTKLGELGLGLYRSPSKKVVMFNPNVIDGAELKKADQSGQLDKIAVSLDTFEQAQAPAAGEESPAAGATQPLSKGLTPRAQSRLAGTRIKALMDDEEPTARPVPGGGRILNSFLQRAV
jgi:hypothetical protein